MKYPDDFVNKVVCGDSFTVLKGIPAGSVDCVVTSPHYWALRSYGNDVKELGKEKTFQEYISKLVAIFDEVKRVLKPGGTCWVNLGDTYTSDGKKEMSSKIGSGIQAHQRAKNDEYRKSTASRGARYYLNVGLKTKSLCCIPDRFKIAMVDGGWICRNDIIWFKRSCMPSSVKDRFTIDYERIFFFVKQKKYYFEQQFEPSKDPEDDIRRLSKAKQYNNDRQGGNSAFQLEGRKINTERIMQGRNMRTVWDIPTQPSSIPHFAMYPEALVERMIRAGCPEFVCNKCGKAREKIYKINNLDLSKRPTEKDKLSKIQDIKSSNLRAEKEIKEIGLTDCGCNAGFSGGIVLDPFAGAGTTCVVAKRLKRNYIGIDIFPKYCEIARKRIDNRLGVKSADLRGYDGV